MQRKCRARQEQSYYPRRFVLFLIHFRKFVFLQYLVINGRKIGDACQSEWFLNVFILFLHLFSIEWHASFYWFLFPFFPFFYSILRIWILAWMLKIVLRSYLIPTLLLHITNTILGDRYFWKDLAITMAITTHAETLATSLILQLLMSRLVLYMMRDHPSNLLNTTQSLDTMQVVCIFYLFWCQESDCFHRMW